MAVAWGTPAGMAAEELLPDEAQRARARAEVRDFAGRGRRRDPRPRRRRAAARRRRARCTCCSTARTTPGRAGDGIEGIDRETAKRRLARMDRFRRAYLESLYGVDLREPGLFHLVIDSTAIALGDCVEIIAAPRSRWSRASRRVVGVAGAGRAAPPEPTALAATRSCSAPGQAALVAAPALGALDELEAVMRTVGRPVARPMRDARFWPWRTLGLRPLDALLEVLAHDGVVGGDVGRRAAVGERSVDVLVVRAERVAELWRAVVDASRQNQLSSSSRPLPRCTQIRLCCAGGDEGQRHADGNVSFDVVSVNSNLLSRCGRTRAQCPAGRG